MPCGRGAPRSGRRVEQRHGPITDLARARKHRRQRRQLPFAGQVQACGIAALGAEQLRWQSDLRVRRAQGRERAGERHGIFDQLINRDLRIGDAVDEGCVGAVLKQTPHQVGEQRFVAPDGRIDAAGTAELVLAHHFLVQRLAHSVQALEFVLAGIEIATGQLHHGGQRVRVVRGELREHGIRGAQQPARGGQIGHIGVDLARVDRKVGLALDLRALDLAVPVGALDQPNHQAVLGAARQVDHPVDHVMTAFLVGLQNKADPVPAGQVRVETQRFEQVERDLQPIRLLGIDVQRDVVAAREQRQVFQARQQLGANPLQLRARVTRVQGR